MIELTVSASFEAAHVMQLGEAADGRRTMHGHSYVCRASFRPPQGELLDLDMLRRKLEGVAAELDHTTLNEVEGLEVPSMENVARHIHARLRAMNLPVCRVVMERPTLGYTVSFTSQDGA
jgi:6-pyruvoyltetrahydropterin/6-carboxytetrahydropterin synthase